MKDELADALISSIKAQATKAVTKQESGQSPPLPTGEKREEPAIEFLRALEERTKEKPKDSMTGKVEMAKKLVFEDTSETGFDQFPPTFALQGEAQSVDEDLPTQAIRQLMRTYPEVVIRLSRRGERGQGAVIYNGVKIKTDKLLLIDELAKEAAGGGRYRVEVKDPEDLTKHLMPPITFNVEGPPKPPRPINDVLPEFEQEQKMQNKGDQSQSNGPMWGRSFPGWYSVGPQPPTPPWWWSSGYWSRFSPASSDENSDQKSHVERLINENRELREMLLRREAENERRMLEVQLKALEAKIDRLAEERSRAGDLSAMVAAIAPVLSSVVTARSGEAQKGIEAQMQMLGQVVSLIQMQNEKKQPSLSEELARIIPTVMPILNDILKARSPEAQVNVIKALADTNLTSISLMTQMIENIAQSVSEGKEQPWWVPMLKQALDGATKVAAEYAKSVSRVASTGADEPPPVLAQSIAIPATPNVTPHAIDVIPSDAASDSLAKVLPPGFRTPEWIQIFQAIISGTDTPKRLAKVIALHIEHCIFFGKLPHELRNIFAEPEKVVEVMLADLKPISSRDSSFFDELRDCLLHEIAELKARVEVALSELSSNVQHERASGAE